MRFRSICAWLVCAVAFCSIGLAAERRAAAPEPAALKGIRRIVFFGDSITYSGQYIAYFESYLLTRFPDRQYTIINVGLPSETISGLSEPSHMQHGFPRPGLLERLDRALEKTKPDLAFACYGMNDGIYMPLSDERFKAYQDGLNTFVSKTRPPKSQVIILTPPPFDPLPLKGRTSPDGADGPYENYDQVLDRYSQWIITQRDRGWSTIDFHGPISRHIAERRKTEPGYILAGDGVHTNAFGHWLMAQELLLRLGMPAEVDSCVIQFKGAKGSSTRAKDITMADHVIEFTWQTRLPMPMDRAWDAKAVEQERIVDRLNQHRLTITGLVNPKLEALTNRKYEVVEAGKVVGSTTGKELARGINLASLPGLSTNQRSAELLKLVASRQRLVSDAYLTDIGHKRPGMGKGEPLERALRTANELDQRIRQLAGPATLTLTLRPAGGP